MGLANYLSRRSRDADNVPEEVFLGEENEWLIVYSKEILQQRTVNYFIFGHRHLAIDFTLNEKSRYINLGDWIKGSTYAVFDGNTTELKHF